MPVRIITSAFSSAGANIAAIDVGSFDANGQAIAVKAQVVALCNADGELLDLGTIADQIKETNELLFMVLSRLDALLESKSVITEE